MRFANRSYEEGLWRGRGDGSPPSRGHGREYANNGKGREDTGWERWDWLWGSDRFFTSLRYVQNDMWGVLRSE